jgi:mannosyltransferase OCH1-like enzyme
MKNNIYIIFIILVLILCIILYYLLNYNKYIKDKTVKYPKVIYFCNKTLDKMDIMSKKWKDLNPEYKIELYDNKMCENFLLDNYGQLYKDIFNYLKDGPIKADFWRICILYKYGGVYSDIDNVPLIPLADFIDNNVDFVTCSSYVHLYFNPNFIVSTKNNVILKDVIDWYINNYNNRKKYDYWDWSIQTAFTDTIHINGYDGYKEGLYSYKNIKIQIIEETPGKNHLDAHNMYMGKRVFNNRSELWDHNKHEFK